MYTKAGELESFEEAMQMEAKKKWELGMDEEMDSLMQNQTWDLVKLPTGKNTFHNKSVYRVKKGGQKQYKERLMVKGFAHKIGIDFE